MDRLLNRLVDSMRENGIIKNDDDYDIVRFGAEILFTKTVFMLTAILVGVLTHSLPEIIFFILVFEPLRIFCGGYHARSKIRCFCASVSMVAAVIILNKVISVSVLPVLSVITIVFSSTIIFLFAPLGTPNKPLDETEIEVYRKRARIILSVILAAAVITFVLHGYRLLFIIALGLLAVSLLLILGKIRD
ncbi:MAG: accessory gene regulator B family protein [Oscillospiraceae bacterium]|nr:accessory gene regulator B family protein [Oscillospiraceae bacterium]